MPTLANPRHERFAQEVANGVSGAQAYRSAGFVSQPNAARASAARLLAQGSVRARVTELQADRARMHAEAAAVAAGELGITAQWLMAKAEEARLGAMNAGQHAAAVSAIKELGILSGHRVEKREHLNRNLGDMTDDELERIARGGGEGASEAPRGTALPH